MIVTMIKSPTVQVGEIHMPVMREDEYAENKETIHCALILECKEISAATNLLPFGSRATIENIINNIIYLGLPKRISFLDASDKEGKPEEVTL
jgi:hypothetical protein